MKLIDLDFYAENFDRLLTGLFLVGFMLFVASSFVGSGADLIAGDSREYFEYARSMVAEGRLPRTHIKYPCGVALIGAIGYLPAVLAGKVLATIGVIATTDRLKSGWAIPLQIAFCIPLLALSFIALRANVATFGRLGYPSRVVRPMVLFWIVATNVGFYLLKEPALSEGGTYATLSLYYWALIGWFYVTPEERAHPRSLAAPQLRHAIIAGLFLGLAGTIRQQNILHALALPLLLVTQARWLFGPERRVAIAAAIRTVITVAVASGLLFILPWVAWYAIEGRIVLFSYGEEHFNFASPHPFDALFHPGYHGLFTWHPAFAIAAIGLVAFLRQQRDLRAAWAVPILVQFYMIASWHWLSFGASVGHRGYFTTFPLLLAGWVAAGDTAVRRGWSRQLLGAVMVLTVVNAAITLLLVTGRWNTLGLPPR